MNKNIVVHFLPFPEEKEDEDIFKYLGYVSDERKLRIEKFRFQRDKKESLLAGLFLRKVLSDCTGIAIEKLEFGYGEYEKPFLKNVENYFFSMSHTKNACAIAVDDEPLGIDIEFKTGDKALYAEISKYNFTQNETQTLEKAGYSQDLFWKIWTAKEAYVKWLGTGLHTELESFDVLLKQQECQLITFQFEENALTLCSSLKEVNVEFRYWDVSEVLQAYD